MATPGQKPDIVATPGRVGRTSAALALGKLASMAAGLVLAVLIARQLGAAGIGVYAASVGFYQVLRSAGEGGARTWLVREVARDGSDTSRALVHLASMAAVRAAVVIPLGLLLIPLVGMSSDLTKGFQIVLIGFMAGVMTPIQEAVFYAYQRTQHIMFGEFGLAFLTTAISVILLQRGHGVSSLLAVFVALRVILVAVYFLIIHLAVVPVKARLSFRYAIGLVKGTRAFAASSVLSALFSRCELMTLSVMGSPAQIGYYGAGSKLVEPWTVIPQTVMPNVLPVLSRSYASGDGNAPRIVLLSIRLLQAVALPVTMLLVVLAEPLVNTLFGAGLADAVIVVQILAGTVALQFLNAVLWRVLVARGDEARMLKAQALTIAPRVVCTVGLTWWLSATGAAISALAATALHAVLLARSLTASGEEIRLLSLTWRCAAAALGAGLLVWPAVDRLPLAPTVALATVVYLLAATLLRALSREELTLLARVLSFRVHRPRQVLS
jgi:O-antigen/teichoic acid export membrane protein